MPKVNLHSLNKNNAIDIEIWLYILLNFDHKFTDASSTTQNIEWRTTPLTPK